MLFWLAVILPLDAVVGDVVDIDLKVDRSNWKDPLDPLSKYFDDKTALELCKKELSLCHGTCKGDDCSATVLKPSEPCNDPTLKLVIRSMLERLNVDIDQVTIIHKSAYVHLGSTEVGILKRFLNGNAETLSEREQVREILENFIVQQVPEFGKEKSFFSGLMEALQPYLLVLNVAVLGPAIFILFSNRFSNRSMLSVFFLLCFGASFIMVYYRKYQENIAARLSRAYMSTSEHCAPKGLLFGMLLYFRGFFSVKEKDTCLLLHEDIYVDPFFEISPLVVLSDVISHFIFTPLGIFGHHFNHFFNEFYRDSPLHLIFIKTITFMFLILALTFWFCRYRIRTIFGTIEPAEPAPSITVSPMLQSVPGSAALKIAGFNDDEVKMLVSKKSLSGKDDGADCYVTASSSSTEEEEGLLRVVDDFNNQSSRRSSVPER